MMVAPSWHKPRGMTYSKTAVITLNKLEKKVDLRQATARNGESIK